MVHVSSRPPSTCFSRSTAWRAIWGGSAGDWPASYEDARHPFTPAWQEQFTGVSAKDVIRFAREWGRTAETTKGRCMVIIGAGVNHWYHNNLIYRACITALMVTGCIGRNGGGWNHYVGQEKLVPIASWAPIAFGRTGAGHRACRTRRRSTTCTPISGATTAVP